MTQTQIPSLDTAVYFPQPAAGYLRITGRDRVAFLQRQTTNDLNRLAPERSVTTVLVTPAARILDVLHVFTEEDRLGVITLPGKAAETANFLKGRIFFMDQVAVEDTSAEVFQVDLEGMAAAQALQHLGFDRAPQLDETLIAENSGITLRVIGRDGLAGLGYRLVTPSGQSEALVAWLQELEIPHLEPEQREILRVEAGLPGAGSELSAEYTPLETGLQDAVSDQKGCYTGQEVLARQLTYDKVTQRLSGLRLESPVEPGARVSAAGRSVGVVTSAVRSPRLGPIALAVLKRPHHEPGTEVVVGGDAPDAGGVRGTVHALPFKTID